MFSATRSAQPAAATCKLVWKHADGKMTTRKRMIALGSILAVAGCGGGGSTPATMAKPATNAQLPLSTGHLTINPTLLRHAASSTRRRPAFVDGIGDANADPMYLVITSTSPQTDGTFLSPPPTTVSVSLSSGAVQATVPLYGPGGYIRVKEVIGSVAPQIT